MSLTTEQLRALCIKHGIHPNAENRMPRNAWAAINELNDMLPVDGIWPIARLSIDDSGQCIGATLYATGLPAGEHDVFQAAVVAPTPAPTVEPLEPMSDEKAFKLYTGMTGQRLPNMGGSREQLLSIVRMTEKHYGIGAQKGDA